MAQFKVGDIAVIRDHPDIKAREYIGFEVTILEIYSAPIDPVGHDCKVRISDGKDALAALYLLRKKDPPEDRRVVSWDECVWRPAHVLTGLESR